MSHSSSSNGCASCGGSTHRPPAPAAPTYDRCAGGLITTAQPVATANGCGCGGAGGCTGQAIAPAPRNYNKADCPTLAISCETKQVLRDCTKVALCDFLRCIAETVCPDGRFDLTNLRANPQLQTQLINCVGQLACSFIHCVPNTLCPEPPAPTPVIDCLPCGYAVEVRR